MPITPTSGDDFLVGTADADIIDGLGGNDEILGLDGADSLLGSDGNDTLDGGLGNDTLDGGNGFDSLMGGDGDDLLTDSGTDGAYTFAQGGAGQDSLQVSSGVAELHGGSDDDMLVATGTDIAYLYGEVGNDSLQVSSGYGELDGGIGDDTLVGGTAGDSLHGGAGSDTLTGGGGLDTFRGLASELNGDRITDYEAGEKILLFQNLTSASQVQLATAGADTELRIDTDNNGTFETVLTLSGTVTGNIILTSQDGGSNNVIRIVPDDTGTPTSGDDFLVGTADADIIDGLGGNDEILGLDGADSLLGSDGNDTLDGGLGNDTLDGGNGFDSLMGGDGDDLLTDSGTDGAYTFAQGGAGQDSLQVSSGVAELHGGSDDDMLVATGTDIAYLYGEVGNDSLQVSSGYGELDGGIGDDTLVGGTAGDSLHGGAGSDTLTGGGGLDTFRGLASELNGDRITDYEAGEKILLFQNLTSASQVQLATAGADTELRIDADNNGTFETVLTLSGTVTGNIILTSQDGGSNNVIRIAPVDSSDGPDSIIGSAQDDIINALAGNDTIMAGGGADLVNAGDGDDLIDGGTGNDNIDGGDGTDLLVLAGSWAGYTITQSSGLYTIIDRDPSNGDEGTDTVANIEQITFNDLTASPISIADALNDAPLLTAPLAAQAASEDVAFTFTLPAGAFSDADQPFGDTLIYTATLSDGNPLPTWLGFDPNTGTFSGIPGNSDVGTLQVRITATDAGGKSAFADFALVIANVNDLPTGTVTITGTPTEGQTLTASDTLADADGLGPISYQWQRGGVDVAGATGSTYVLSEADAGTAITVVAHYTDGGGTAESVVSDGVTIESPASSEPVSVFSDSATPAVLSEADRNPVELGMQFEVTTDGMVSGIRFYKGSGDLGTHTGSLWTASGTLLGTVTFSNETASGWQTATFATPVALTADTAYVVSYHSNGHYAESENFFTSDLTNGPFVVSADGHNGVYAYGSSSLFPTNSYRATNYWVDVLFNPSIGTSMDWLNQIDPIHAKVYGTSGDDTLAAMAGDVAYGEDGDDDLSSMADHTALIGGRGVDNLTTDVTITAESGETVHGLAIQLGGDDNDTLNATVAVQGGSSYKQVLIADVLADGGSGDDVINANAKVGEPTPAGVTLRTEVFGGSGDDTIHATADGKVGDRGAIGVNDVENTVDGGDGSDHIIVYARTETVADSGTAINVVYGGIGEDIIDATAYGASQYSPLVKNSLHGGRDNDFIHAFNFSDSNSYRGVGINELWGDEGDDTLEAIHSTDGENVITELTNNLDGGIGDDYLKTESTALGGHVTAVNHLDGGSGADTLTASIVSKPYGGYIQYDLYHLSNILNGGDDNDALDADLSLESSNPGVMDDSTAENRLDGGSGNDTLKAHLKAASHYTSPDSLLEFYHVSNVLIGGDGDDSLEASLSVTSAADAAESSMAENRLDGGTGNDTLMATIAPNSPGASFLTGGSGNDRLTVNGGTGNLLDGGDDNDTLTGGTGNDNIDGGDGTDLLVLGGSWSGYTITQSNGLYTIVDRDPSNGDEGTDTAANIELIAFNGSTARPISITDALNDAPVVASPLADQVAIEDASFTYTLPAGTFTDADQPLGDTLTYMATLSNDGSLPAWLAFDPDTQTFSGTPGNGDVGTLQIRITATDASGASAFTDFALTAVNALGSGPVSVFSDSATPAVLSEADRNPVELGMQFEVTTDGMVSGIRFYKGSGDLGTHTGSLWTASGTLLGTVTFSNETASGWQTATFATPVALTADTAYVVSYHSNGHYAESENFFTSDLTNGPFVVSADGHNGVYAYGSSSLFPTNSYRATNYWVDVLFNPSIGTSMDWLNQIDPIHAKVYGTSGDDTLAAMAGDVAYGEDGDDDLSSMADHTALIGGRGVDNLTTDVTITAESGETVHGLAIQLGGDDNDTLNATLNLRGGIWSGPSSHEQILTADILADGGSGDDVINATAKVGEPTTAGITLKTEVLGGTGDDTIHATADGRGEDKGAVGANDVENTIDGGDGRDHITVYARTDQIAISGTAINIVDGGEGNDVIDATADSNSLETLLVKNSLHGGGGDDLVHAFGFTGSNSMYGTGVNELWGDEGNDTLEAIHNAGDNSIANLTSYLDGGIGDDHLTAETTARDGRITATNHLEGGPGWDTLSASIDAMAPGGLGSGDLYHLSNILNGGADDDALTAFLSVKSDPFTMDGSSAENRLDGGSGNDTLMATVAPGSPGASFLTGGSGNDQLTVIGGTGNMLDGGDDNDTLTGGSGDDWMIGGEGTDAFVFAPGNGHDTIADLEQGKDMIDFTAFASAGIHGFADLSIDIADGNSVIHFDANHAVTVTAVTSLNAKDFWFA